MNKRLGIDYVKHDLLSRRLDYTKYSCFFNEEDCSVSFLLHNLVGKISGYQTYRPWYKDKKNNSPETGRYYLYSINHENPIFGLEQDSGVGPVFIVEGIFKSVVLHNLGFNSYAVLCNNPIRLTNSFNLIKRTRRLIAIGDNDQAGNMLVKRIGYGIISPKDLDEMEDFEIISLISKLI